MPTCIDKKMVLVVSFVSYATIPPLIIFASVIINVAQGGNLNVVTLQADLNRNRWSLAETTVKYHGDQYKNIQIGIIEYPGSNNYNRCCDLQQNVQIKSKKRWTRWQLQLICYIKKIFHIIGQTSRAGFETMQFEM